VSAEKGRCSSTGSAAAGQASAIAAIVELRSGEEAAYRPSAACSSGGPTTSTTRSVGSVSVPVLSRQRTSTEASDSIALSC
jgi:hypothetical protein